MSDFDQNDKQFKSGSEREYPPPDYGFFARMDYWKPEELAALALGYLPEQLVHEVANQRNIYDQRQRNFLRIHSLILRSIEVGKLQATIRPDLGLEWLVSKEIPFAQALRDEVYRFHPLCNSQKLIGHLFARLQSLDAEIAELDYELTERSDEHSRVTAAWGSLAEDMMTALRDAENKNALLSAENSNLRDKIEKLEARSLETNDNEQEYPKALRSKNILIATMAVKGYGFDPNAARSSVPSEIANDAAYVGLSISNEIVKKHISQICAALLPDYKSGEK